MGEGKNTKPFQHFFSKRENIFLIFIGLIPIFSPSLFERFFNEYITKPILENIESNIFVDIIVIILTMIIVSIYDYKFGKKYFLSTFISKIVFILTFWYLFYRFKGGWHYLSFSFYPSFFYSDILLVIPFAHLFILSQKLYQKKQKADISTNGFLIDEPTKVDSLGRKDYAEAIATKIKNSYPIKYAMAIGITGKWGSGKTTFMGLIEKAINQEDKPITINFKPRKNHDSNNIIIDFFDELGETLGVYNENLSFNIHQYLKQLTKVDDNIYFKTIDFLNTIIFGKKSTQDMFDEINKAIQQIERQVIIFIDDIDRLDSKEVIEVIKLIRFSANFNNVVFIVAFDKGYVINAINEFNTYEKEWFLEKIFQVEFPLPTFETNTLKKKLEEKLISNFPEYETEFKNYFAVVANHLIIDKCIITMRDVVRFTNAFCLDFDLVKGEVLVKDFINISLLKLKYSAVYEFLFKEQKRVLISKFSPIENVINIEENLSQIFFSINVEKFSNLLRDNFKQLNISENMVEEITEIIVQIFSRPSTNEPPYRKKTPESFNSDNILSIRKPSNFGIYFSIRLLEGNLSEIDFRNARKENYDKFILKINEWLKKGLLSELLDKIEAITFFDDKNDFEKIIKSLFFIGTEHPAESKVNQLIQIKSMNSGNGPELNAKIYYNNTPNDYKKFLIQTFQNGNYSIDFRKELLQSIQVEEIRNHQKAYLKFILEETERVNLWLGYFHTYFNSHRPIKDIMNLYASCIFNDKIAKEISALVLKSLREENRVFEMLDYCMPKENGEFVFDTFHTNYRHFRYLFESVDDLKEFINQINYNAENPSIKEYIQFLENNFNEIIYYK